MGADNHQAPDRRRIDDATRLEKKPLTFLLGNRKGIPHLLRYINDTKRLEPIFGNIEPPPDFVIKDKKTKESRAATDIPPPPA